MESGGITIQSFADGIAVVVISIDGAAGVQQTVVVVVAVGSLHTVDGFVGAVAYPVVLVISGVAGTGSLSRGQAAFGERGGGIEDGFGL